ncbi:syntaxin-4 [Ambystoma mexicanum]|uniref:syntaxin-4 n=1 Tax=Ambystoma mexicanum TaxID=8296 RepID=UPI0037E76B96
MRDRTSELRKVDDDSDDGSIEQKKLLERSALGDNHTLKPEDELFFQKARDVRQRLHNLNEKVRDLEVMQNTILGTPLPDESLKKTLQTLREEIKNLAKGIRTTLQSMEPSKEETQDGLYDVNLRIRRTQHGILSQQFIEAINKCNAAQSHYRDKNVKRIHRQLEITGVDVTDEKLDEMLESGQSSVFTANILKDMEVTKEALSEIEIRHGEIMKLEKSIQELHDMFMYLAMEVEAQGETIDRIEKNILTSSNYVEKAKMQLETAIDNRKKSRKKKIMIGICVAVLLLILTIIIAVAIAAG